MAGTSALSKHFGLRVPLDLWKRLQAASIERGISIAAILLSPWGEPTPAPGRPMKATADRSAEIEALQARILELETQAAWFASKEAGWETQNRAAAGVIAKQAEEIADLKKQLARALRPPIPAKLALALRDGLTAPPSAAVGSLLKPMPEPKGRKP